MLSTFGSVKPELPVILTSMIVSQLLVTGNRFPSPARYSLSRNGSCGHCIEFIEYCFGLLITEQKLRTLNGVCCILFGMVYRGKEVVDI